MRKLIILSLAVLTLLSCKKNKQPEPEPDVVDTDQVKSIFRVITNADNNYHVAIVEIYPDTPTGDTIRNIKASSFATFDFSFSPRIGSRIIVDAETSMGTMLDCTIGYKASRLGVDTVDKSNNKIRSHFEYVIID